MPSTPTATATATPSPGADAYVAPEKMLKALRRSGLVTDEALQSALNTVKVKHGGDLPQDTATLCRQLVAVGLITDWQAWHLALGRSKGYFLGKYKLLKHLGDGGMATVFLGEHTVMNKRLAIKVLPRARLEGKPQALERFQAEARTAAMLEHENIVRTLDIDQVDGRHFIVLEYIDGSDLDHVTRKRGALPFARAVGYLRQAAAGLQQAHERGVLHRDVKPLNMLITRDGVLKMSDFGLARLRHDEPDDSSKKPSVVGTADYMAPEQARNSNTADGRADLYALGCTLYFMLTGKAPYRGGTLRERLAQHQMDPAPDLLEARPDTPEDLVAIYQRLMEKDPNDRYATATELLKALDRYIAEHSGSGDFGEISLSDSLAAPMRLSGGTSASGLRPSPAAADSSLFGDSQLSTSGSVSNDDDLWGDLGDDLGASGGVQLSGTTLAPVSTLKSEPVKEPADTTEIVRRVGIGALAVLAGFVLVMMWLAATSKAPTLNTQDLIKATETNEDGSPRVIFVDK